MSDLTMSPATAPEMHRMWDIPEIVYEIFSWIAVLDNDYLHRESRKTFLALLRTAPVFFAAAASQIWVDVNAWNLLKVVDLPGNVQSPLLQFKGLERYATYDRWIRSLSIDAPRRKFPKYANKPYMQALLERANYLFAERTKQFGPPLPRLRTMSVELPQGFSSPLGRFAHKFAAMCTAAHALEEFKYSNYEYDFFTYEPARQNAEELLRTLPGSCPSLRTLKLTFGTTDKVSDYELPESVIDVLVEVLPQLPQLSTIEAGAWALLPHILAALRGLPKLQELVIKDTRGDNALFRQLPNSSVSNQSPFNTLVKLHYAAHLGMIPHILPGPLGTIEYNGVELAQMPALEHLTIRQQTKHVNPSNPNMRLDSLLARLQTSPNLVHLDLMIPVNSPMTDKDIIFIANTWPGMQHLALRSDRDLLPYSNMSAASLVTLATDCRRLTYLRLCVSSLAHHGIPKYYEPSEAAVQIKLGIYVADYRRAHDDDVEDRAKAIIRQLWPSCKFDSPDWEYRW